MYHEVASPYAFLWHLREGVKPDGLVIVVDSNRPVSSTGCRRRSSNANLQRSAWQPVKFSMLTGGEAYLMAFRAGGPRPAPEQIKPCRALEKAQPPQAGALAAGEHQMIEHRAVERFGGGREAAGRAAVGFARPRIAARMIVGKHDAGAADARPRRR